MRMFRWSHLLRVFLLIGGLFLTTRLMAQVISAGTYTGQVVAGDSISSGTVTFTGGSSLSSSSLSLANSTGFYWQQTGVLSGLTFTLGTSANIRVVGIGNSLSLNSSTLTTGNGAYFYLSGANTSLTLDSATAITGGVTLYTDGSAGTAITNQGTLTHNVGSGSIYAANFTNAGTIRVPAITPPTPAR
jgi:hypothetical protein